MRAEWAAGSGGGGRNAGSDVSELYRAHRTWLTSWFHRRLSDRHEAEDLTQDAFVRVVVRHATLDLSQPRALLSAIAKGLLIDHFRRHALEQAYLAELACADALSVPSAEAVADTLQALREVDRLLAGLSAKARAAFLFSRIDGLTHAEIAGALNVSVSRVRQYLAQALRKMVDASLERQP